MVVALAEASAWAQAIARRGGGSLPDDDIAAIDRLPIVARVIEADDYLYREGDSPVRCAYIVSGTLCQSKVTRSGERQIIGLRMQNEFVGLASMLLRELDHDVQALTRCEMLEVGTAELIEAIEARPRIGRILMADALITGAIAQDWVVNAGRRTGHARVAHLLCELALRLAGTTLTRGARYELPLNQEQVGDAVGLHRVAVNRILRDLAAAKLIQHCRRSVTVLDPAGLEEVADFSARYLHLSQSERDRRRSKRGLA